MTTAEFTLMALDESAQYEFVVALRTRGYADLVRELAQRSCTS